MTAYAYLPAMLGDIYGLERALCTPARGGWSALAFRVESPQGVFFLKVYEKRRAAALRWASQLERYLPVVDALGKEALVGRIIEPVPALSGRWTWENAQHIGALFRHVEGRTLGAEGLSDETARELGLALAQLHAWRGDKALLALLPREEYAVPSCAALERFTVDSANPAHADLRAALAPLGGRLDLPAVRCRAMAQDMARRCPPLVPCHCDVHGGNLMEGPEGLVVLDWEGLTMAPAEADLFFLARLPGGKAAERAYRESRPLFRPDSSALEYYALRRDLEDIREFIEQLTQDRPNPEERAESLGHLAALCERLAAGL